MKYCFQTLLLIHFFFLPISTHRLKIFIDLTYYWLNFLKLNLVNKFLIKPWLLVIEIVPCFNDCKNGLNDCQVNNKFRNSLYVFLIITTQLKLSNLFIYFILTGMAISVLETTLMNSPAVAIVLIIRISNSDYWWNYVL